MNSILALCRPVFLKRCRMPRDTAVEMLKDNASPVAGEVYAALDMPFTTLVGQIADAHTAVPS
jgi:hypothetical protein